MTIGKPIRCYPLKKKDGKFVYLPTTRLSLILRLSVTTPKSKLFRSIGKPYKNLNTTHAKPSVKTLCVSRTI